MLTVSFQRRVIISLVIFAKFKVIYLKLFKLVRLDHFQGGVLLEGVDTEWLLSQRFCWASCVDVLQCLALQFFYVKVKYSISPHVYMKPK